ncbi:MAG: hypothetical protein WCW87_01475 [Candidatus Paceibacterota bacterium]
MKKITEWFETENKSDIRFFIYSTVLIYLYICCVLSVLNFLGISEQCESNVMVANSSVPNLINETAFYWNVAWGEEVWARLIPFILFVKCFGRSRITLCVCFLAGLAFGLAHIFRGFDHWFFPIIIQGGVGIYFWILFLKCGGFQGKYLKAFSYSSVAHFLWNILLTRYLIIFSFPHP